mgnify:CR=1 FL=1
MWVLLSALLPEECSGYVVQMNTTVFGKSFSGFSEDAARGAETITHAYFFLIRERMARFPTVDWDEFSRRNSDLLTWKDGILTRYYEEATLKSDLARTVFVFPDKVI